MEHQSLIEYFTAEADDHINVLEKGILNLEKNPGDLSGIEDMFRSAHTLKGSAALVKLTEISKIAHLMEDILENIKDGKRNTTSGLATWMFKGLDTIKLLIKDVKSGKVEDATVFDSFKNALPVMTAEEPLVPNRGAKAAPLVPSPPLQIEEKRTLGRRKDDVDTIESKYVRIDIDNVEQLMNLMGELTILKNFLTSKVAGINDFRDEISFAGRRLISEVTNFTERYAYAMPDRTEDKVKYIDPLLSEFSELEFDKYDEVNLFARKLNEITDDINEAMKSLSEFFNVLSAKVNSMERLVNDSKELISESRMVTIGKLYQRFTRAVRDISLENNKKIRFLTSGYETRIDTIIFERIYESILHILRNAIAHGIEKLEDRRKKGKPEEGTIQLVTRREGNAITIEISDDGRGIDFDLIKSTALRKGLVSPAAILTKEDLLHMLFASGFSTTRETDMISGRGVGLDIVKETLSFINGSIEIFTERDKGTTFRLKVPLSLIIINVVIFNSGGIQFIIPSTLVQELTEVEVSTLVDSDTLTVRDITMPIKSLNALLGLKDTGITKSKPVIVLNISGKHFGLVVDHLTGQEDTIIKPFGKFLEGIKHFSGVSISADGKIRPVINPLGLIDTMAISLEQKGVDIPAEPSQDTVLIVDDSLSVRKFTSMILQSKNFKVLSATNGLEALNIIEENRVDLVITDLEMPVMHGYELLNELKRRGLLNIMPVVVLTSRSSEGHRNKAMELGASGFLIKPFDETILVETIKNNLESHHLT